MSKQLATAKRDIDVELDLQEFAPTAPDRSQAPGHVPQVRAARAPPPARGGAGLGRRRSARPAGRGGDHRAPPRRRRSTPCRALPQTGAPSRSGLPRSPRTRCSPPIPTSVSASTLDGSPRSSRATPNARNTSSKRSARRPVTAHDAKSLGRVPANLAHDTEVGAYLLEPARRAYPFRELTEERGFGTEIADEAAADALLVHALADLAAGRDPRPRPHRPVRERRAAARRILRDMELAGSKLDTERLARDLEPGQGRGRRARARDLRHVRRGVHARLPQAARGDPVRQARPVAQATRQDRLLDRRARPPGDPARAPDHSEDRALARAHQARPDLPRRAPAADRRRRPDSHHLQPDGRHHRAPVVKQPEPAEHPNPNPSRSRDPRLLRGRARQPPGLAPTTHRSSCASWPTSPARTR